MRKWMLMLALAAVPLASAKTYSVVLDQPSLLGGKRLKPGDYKLQLEGSKVILIRGHKTAAEATVTVKKLERKTPYTEVAMRDVNGTQLIESIWLGGTELKLDFN